MDGINFTELKKEYRGFRIYDKKNPKIEMSGTSSIDMTGVRVRDLTVIEFYGRYRRKGNNTASLWKVLRDDGIELIFDGGSIRKLIKLEEHG